MPTTPSETFAVCHTCGSVGLRVYLGAAVTNAPVTFKFDNYVVKSL